MTESRGEVFDLGYQHYEGPREGRMRARKALWMNGVRTALGLGRGWSSKVLPVLLFASITIAAVVISIAASVIDIEDIEDIPGHAGYYQVISIFLLFFSAIIAPELLCPDRRDRVIDLYLVRPLSATDYVFGRWMAFFSVTLLLAYLGQVILFVGFTLAAPDQLDYIRDNWLDIPRFLLAGIVMAIFITSIPMAVSAFTTRRAYAAAFVIGLSIISYPVAESLTECRGYYDASLEECDPATGDGAKWFALLNIGLVPMHLNDLIFAEDNRAHLARLVTELPIIIPVAWYLLLTVGPGFALWWRYQRLRL